MTSTNRKSVRAVITVLMTSSLIFPVISKHSGSHIMPKVDLRHSGNVSALLGKTASLRCRVYHRGNHTVSWIRHRDLHLLTVDQYTYTSDQRFRALHEASTGDWVLLITSLQPRDKGMYECQIGTTPPKGHFVYLYIVEPETTILGGQDIHINSGSTLNLTCLVQYYARPPDVTWMHQGQTVGYTSSRGGVTVVTESGESTRSSLLIQRAAVTDAGNYTCEPDGGEHVYVYVHVLNDENRAAMYSHGNPRVFNSTWNFGVTLFGMWLITISLWGMDPPRVKNNIRDSTSPYNLT